MGGLIVSHAWRRIFNMVDPQIAGYNEFPPIPHYPLASQERSVCIVKFEVVEPDPVRGASYNPARPMTLKGATESDDIK